MVSRIASIPRRRAGLILGLGALLALLVAVNSVRVLGELPPGGGSADRTEAADDRAAIGERIGYDPLAAATLVLSGSEPVGSATTAVALRALRDQAEAEEGVARAIEGPRSADGRTTTLAVHLDPDLGAEESAAAVERLGEVLDPGILTMEVGGPAPAEEAGRSVLLDEAPGLQLLVLPLIVLLLAGALGVRMAAAALLAAALAVGGSISLLGLVAWPFTVHAAGAVAAAIVALTLAIEAAGALLYRYRDESGTLGPGREAIEYALRTKLKGIAVGGVSIAAVGLALIFVPVPAVSSIGVGLIAAAVVVPAALLVVVSTLILRAEQEGGSALPLLGEGPRQRSGPAPFRWLVALGARGPAAAAAVVAVLITAPAVIPLLGTGAVGSSAAELPSPEQPRAAEDRLAAAFGTGLGGPVILAAEALGEGPVGIAIAESAAASPAIESVGDPVARRGLGVVEARPIARPGSLAGQQAVEEMRALTPAPRRMRVTGTGAMVLDSRTLLRTAAPVALGAILVALAAGWAVVLRSRTAPLLILPALPGPIVGVGALCFVFEMGRLQALVDYQPAGAPHLLSFVAVAAPLLAIGLARSADLASALREELLLGGGPRGVAARAGTLTLMPAALAGACAIAAAGVWVGSDLLVAKELAVGLVAGLLADVVVGRGLLAPAVVELGGRPRVASARE